MASAAFKCIVASIAIDMIVADATFHIGAGSSADLDKVVTAAKIDRLDIGHRQRVPGVAES